MNNLNYDLKDLAAHIHAEIIHNGNNKIEISNLSSFESANQFSLCALFNKKFVHLLNTTNAAACIIKPEFSSFAPKHLALLVHPHPYKAYAQLSQLFVKLPRSIEFRASTAYISPTAKIGRNCQIQHGAYIEDEVVIGDNCKIGVNSYIGNGVVIGNNCKIENQASVTHARMGNDVVIHPGARIGQEGFGFASDAEGHYSIAHQGLVIIGNHVHIGANTCIDRGSLENTEIGDHVRLDNLIQIGHNVKIGKGSVIAAQTGVAGSTSIGEFVIIGGQAGVNGHITLGNGSKILGKSQVTKNVAPGARVGGYPATLDKEWHHQIICLRKMAKKNKKEA